MALKTTTPTGAVIGSIGELPEAPTARNPNISKEVLLAHGDAGHVTQLSLAHHPDGESCGVHSHGNMDEVCLIWAGEGVVEIDGEQFPARRGDFFAIPVGVPHNLISLSEDFEVLCLGVRALGHEGADAQFWAGHRVNRSDASS
jgi:mannose-6-phosphate isomerase-like protein (cupin superfamily)